MTTGRSLLAFAVLAAAIAVYLAILASASVVRDVDLVIGRKLAQLILIWLIPFIGPMLILRVVYEHSPALVAISKVPWPFRGAVTGHPLGANANRDDIGSGEYGDVFGSRPDFGNAGDIGDVGGDGD
jgi:hypothetical protein